MATWSAFAEAAPDLASETRRLVKDWGRGGGLLATVRNDDLPRIHPVSVAVVDGRLYVFVIARSPKRIDLELDGRYAFHTHQDPDAPSEAALRGRARPVTDPDVRARVAAGWAFTADDGYALFELDIEHAVVGIRPSADDWPPVYSSWHEGAAA